MKIFSRTSLSGCFDDFLSSSLTSRSSCSSSLVFLAAASLCLQCQSPVFSVVIWILRDVAMVLRCLLSIRVVVVVGVALPLVDVNNKRDVVIMTLRRCIHSRPTAELVGFI